MMVENSAAEQASEREITIPGLISPDQLEAATSSDPSGPDDRLPPGMWAASNVTVVNNNLGLAANRAQAVSVAMDSMWYVCGNMSSGWTSSRV